MAWKNGYYYHNKRQGKRVVTEYIGSGYPALLAEQLTERARQEAKAKLKEWQAIKDEQQRLDRMVADFGKLADAMAAAALLLSGYHQSRRKWRKKR